MRERSPNMKAVLSGVLATILVFTLQPNRTAAAGEESVLKQTCGAFLRWTHWRSAVVGRTALGAQYALCEAHDQYTGNVLLFKRLDGAFEFIASGKPAFDISRLIDLGVDPSEASKLVAAISI
jgi:hypothetical protein